MAADAIRSGYRPLSRRTLRLAAGRDRSMPMFRMIVCGLLLTACGGSLPSGTPSPSASPSANASPTKPPQPSNEQLARAYLTAVQPFNEYTCRFLERHGESDDMNVWQEFARTYTGHLAAFGDRLQAIDWNRNTRAEARGLIDALAVAEAGYREAATISRARAFWAALDETNTLDAGVTHAADALRVALGLKAVRPCI